MLKGLRREKALNSWGFYVSISEPLHTWSFALNMNKFKPVRFTEHARFRMMRYQISEEELVECLRNPDKVIGGYKGRKIAQSQKQICD